MGLYTCVIVNPASQNGATGRHWPELRAALDRVLDRWDNHFTLGPGDATRIARQAVHDGYDMVVSVGGDGTNSEVVTGLFRESEQGISTELIKPGMIIATVRQGTGGDFGRFLDLSGSIPQCVEHLQGERTRQADLGLLEYTAHDGSTKRRAFLNIASFGVSGALDDIVNHTTKALGGKVSYLLGAGRAMITYRNQPVRMFVDDQPFFEGKLFVGVMANGQYFGGGMRLASKAEIDDGQLDAISWVEIQPANFLSFADLYSGKVADWATVRYTKGKVVRAEPLDPNQHVLLDVDGEQPGRLPATARVMPGAVRIKTK
jgi:YegS/Rv2252/BmrU family lipid kinase